MPCQRKHVTGVSSVLNTKCCQMPSWQPSGVERPSSSCCMCIFIILACLMRYSVAANCSCTVPRQNTSPANLSLLGRLDGSMEPANEILESASHDRPLVAQTYSAAVTKGTYVPSSPTGHGKERAGNGAGRACMYCFILGGCVSSSTSTLSPF